MHINRLLGEIFRDSDLFGSIYLGVWHSASVLRKKTARLCWKGGDGRVPYRRECQSWSSSAWGASPPLPAA